MTTTPGSSAFEHLRHGCSGLSELCDLSLLFLPSSVAYLAGYPGSRVPAVVSATSHGPAFVAVDTRSPAAYLGAPRRDRERFDASLVSEAFYFDGFVQDREVSARQSYLDALEGALRKAGAERASALGVETRSLPAFVAEWLRDAYPQARVVDVEEALLAARRTKSAREVLLLRRANEVADIAHACFADMTSVAGRLETDAFTQVRSAVEEAAGGPVPIEGELVSGERSSVVRYPGGPSPRRMEQGDAAILDLSAKIGCYWFDCANTHLVGRTGPTVEQMRLIDVARRAFDAAVANLRPGITARAVWKAAARIYEANGVPIRHYFGHQIGVEVNEAPRIVGYDTTVIEPGMVFELEPGAYQGDGGDFGCRFEKTVLVGEAGPEVISQFRWGLGGD